MERSRISQPDFDQRDGSGRVLMCAPTFLPALSDSQSWVVDSAPLDRSLALEQWHRLVDLVESHVGQVVLQTAEPWAPGMTFTRDLGLTIDDIMITLMPASRGPFESPLFAKVLDDHQVTPVNDTPLRLDGGNVLADYHGRLLVGMGPNERPDLIENVRSLVHIADRTAFRVPLAGDRFPHVDMALADLAGRGWLAYPAALPGFDLGDPDWRELFAGRDVIALEAGDGEKLACNLIMTTDVAIGPLISDDLRRDIESTGLAYLATPLHELLKAGGGAHCLTLELPPA